MEIGTLHPYSPPLSGYFNTFKLFVCSVEFTYRPDRSFLSVSLKLTSTLSRNWNNARCRWRQGSAHHCEGLIMCHISVLQLSVSFAVRLHALCSCTALSHSRRGDWWFPFLHLPQRHFDAPKWQNSQGESRRRGSRRGVCWLRVCSPRLGRAARGRARASIAERLFGPGVIAELVQQRYFGSALDPSQSAMSSSQMKHMMAVQAQPTHLLAIWAFELPILPIAVTDQLNWLASIYVA